MADLKTNYVDDVLDSSKNQLRKYQQTQNDDGTVSFVDVTEYSTTGTSFGAKDINDTNAAVNELNNSLGGKQNNLTQGIYTDYLSNITTDKLKPNSVVWITPDTKDTPFTGQYGVAITFEPVSNIYMQICFPYNADVNVPCYRIYANNSWGIWVNF